MKFVEYTLQEAAQVMETMRGLYDLVRLVDPEECRELRIDGDHLLQYGEECYQVWSATARCRNCSSYRACMTRKSTDKTEIFRGKEYKIQSQPVRLRLPDGSSFSCVMEMIHVASMSEEEQKTRPETAGSDPVYLNYHDALTGLYNSQGLGRKVRDRIMQDPDCRYLMIAGNIRNFKLVNQLFGRERGNEILVQIARRLDAVCGPETICGRTSGDHFACFMPYEHYSEERILRLVEEFEQMVREGNYKLRIHLGVYLIENVNMPVPLMIDRAEMAMRTILDSAQERIACYSEHLMNEKLMEQQILNAFDQDLAEGRFHVYLQPQVDQFGRLEGAEALVRWIQEDGSMMMPDRFISVLERSDLISRMDRYVWEEAVKLLHSWEGTPFERLYLSVNVSSKDFYYLDVPEVMEKLCETYRVPNQKLRVEITETTLMKDPDYLISIVERMQKKGFYVEIDDFGKGFSSLSMLKDISADVLKIDMGFIRETRNENRSGVILESVIRMSHQLEMGVVTEGVETQEQMQRLTEMGCGVFQGFYFSRPIPISEFHEKYMKDM